MNISLCMIAKDEEKHIDRCLKSVADIVNEIILVDTGSKDKTIEIAKKYGAKILYHEWLDDFSAARNEGIDAAQGDYILVLDADEELSTEAKKNIRSTLKTKKEGYVLRIRNFQDNSTVVSNVLRIFTNKSNHRFHFPIHEQIADTICGPIEYSDLVINHYGYTKEEDKRKDKSNRNVRILEKMRFQNSPYHLFQLAKEYAKIDRFQEAYVLYLEILKIISSDAAYLPDVVIYGMIAAEKIDRKNEAHELFERFKCQFYDYTQLYAYDGNIFEKEGNYTKALMRYRYVLRTPKNKKYQYMEDIESSTLHNIGHIYETMGENSTALQFYQKSFSLIPNAKSLLSIIDIIGNDVKQLNELLHDVQSIVSLNYQNNLNSLLFRLLENGYTTSYKWLRSISSSELIYSEVFDFLEKGNKNEIPSLIKSVDLFSNLYQIVLAFNESKMNLEQVRLPINMNWCSIEELLSKTKTKDHMNVLHEVAKWKGSMFALPYYLEFYKEGRFDAKSLISIGDALRKAGDIKTSHQFYQKATQCPTTSMSIFRLIESYIGQNDFTSAKSLLELGMEYFSESSFLQQVRKILI